MCVSAHFAKRTKRPTEWGRPAQRAPTPDWPGRRENAGVGTCEGMRCGFREAKTMLGDEYTRMDGSCEGKGGEVGESGRRGGGGEGSAGQQRRRLGKTSSRGGRTLSRVLIDDLLLQIVAHCAASLPWAPPRVPLAA